ncbi:hypothetical protein ACOSQ2_031304 [Xanthoceras sorbifolium]
MWTKLERVYSQQSMARILQLRQQLQSIKKGSDSISDFVLKLKNIGDALLEAGEDRIESLNVHAPTAHFASNNNSYNNRSNANRGGNSDILISNFKALHLFQISKQTAYYASPESVNDQAWYVDSGATNHVTADLNNLSLKQEYRGNDKLVIGDGNHLHISNIGHSTIQTHTTPYHQLHLKNILHVPSITKNLLSISKLTKDNNAFAEFHDNGCMCKSPKSNKHNVNNVHVSVQNICNNESTRLCSQEATAMPKYNVLLAAKTNALIWHAKLGHPASLILQKVLHTLHFPYNVNAPHFCDSCKLGKLHKLPFSRSEIEATAPLEMIYKMALTLMAHAHMPLQYWFEACTTAVFLINNLPTALLRFSSPFELLHHRKPCYHSSISPAVAQNSQFVPTVAQNSQPSLSVGNLAAGSIALPQLSVHVPISTDPMITRSRSVKASTIRVILSLAIHFYWEIQQVDINNAFLNGDLQELVFMHQPEGFEDQSKPLMCASLSRHLLMIEDPQVVVVSSWEAISSLGAPRNKQ